MVHSYDLSSEIQFKKKNRTTPTPLAWDYFQTLEVQRANFYNFHPISMKFCMEVTFGGIQLNFTQRCQMVSGSLALLNYCFQICWI